MFAHRVHFAAWVRSIGLVVATLAVATVPARLSAQIFVGPDGGSLVVFPNTSGQASFYFTGLVSGQSYSWTWTCSGAVTNCTSAPGNLPTTFTATAYGAQVYINFSVVSPWTGRITVSAWGNSVPGSDNGYWDLKLNNSGPAVSTVPTNGDYRDVSKCVANCFDGTLSYATAPYISSDVPRSVQLVYRSDQAHPLAVVQVDAVDTSTVNPVKMSMQLYTPQMTLVPFVNHTTQLYFNWVSHPADGNVNRLAAQLDATSLTTGAYNYTAVIRSYRADGSFRETDVPIRLLVVNEASSPYGAGWSIAGLPRVYPQGTSGAAITEGDGSIAYFTQGLTTCLQGVCKTPYTSPPGDFTALTKTTGGTCNPSPCPIYQRFYPTGATIGFDASGKVISLGGFLFQFKDARFARSMKEVRRRPWSLSFVSKATIAYNAAGLVSTITDSIGKAITLGYDASNHLRWIKDPGGRVDSITVDGSGNLTRIKDWGVTNGQGGQALVLQYDAIHRLVHFTDRRGAAWGRAYDFAGKVASDTAAQVRASGQMVRPVSRYGSTERRVLIDTTTGQGTSSNPGPNVDTAIVRATTTNPLGYTTTYGLDRFGAATLVQQPLGRTTSLSRDVNSAVVRSVSPSGHLFKFTWNGMDLLQTWDSTTGRKTNASFDTTHHVLVIWGDIDSVVNYWHGSTRNARLDSTRVGGSKVIKFTYGSDGRVCGGIDPAGHAETCYFTTTSGFQNTDSIKYALGTVGFRYDGHGQRVLTIDQVQDTLKTVYDSLSRVVMSIGPVHDTTRFYFDDSLHLTRVVDAKGQVSRSWPNALGWADSTADAAGQKDRYQYDSSGSQTSLTNRNGRTITSAYDSLGQARSVTADGRMATFFTDPLGHFVVANDSESVDTLWMDAADRASVVVSCRVLVSGNDRQCFRDSSVYEIRDLPILTALSASGIWGTTQFQVGHHFDIHELEDVLTPGHLTTQSTQSITFVYNVEALDSITTFSALNNLSMTHSYPSTHRTDQVQLSDPTLSAVLGTAYNFDNAERLKTRYHGTLANPDTSRSFRYDRQGNLVQYADTLHHYTTSCQYSWFTGGYTCTGTDNPSAISLTTYAYDSVGNRKDPAGLMALDPGNRLRRWQNFRMDYDLAGNMTVKRTLNTADSTRVLRRDSLFWSALGALDSVRTRDSVGTLTSSVVFGYDGWGRRVRKSGPAGTTRYVWDGQSLLAELDTLGQLVAGYTYYGVDEIASVLRRDRADSSYYYVQDYSHNVVAMLARTGTGNVIDNLYRYEPFGNLEGLGSTPIPNSLRFAGREYDAETQLYYDRARYLDPTFGRFVSEDPTGFNGGINLYAFVGNDPINGWDPTGTRCTDWKLSQELFSDKAMHFFIGDGLVGLGRRWGYTKWWAVAASAIVSGAHEGPFHIHISGRLEIGDGDFTDAKGAPCSGWFDTFFFMVVPLADALFGVDLWPFKWPWIWSPRLTVDQSPPWWNGPISGPPRPIPGSFPPQGPPWWDGGNSGWVGRL